MKKITPILGRQARRSGKNTDTDSIDTILAVCKSSPLPLAKRPAVANE